MAITFYCGSGSPFAWKVWLVLEHKELTYDLELLSFQAGELKKPEFLAINPRGRVPALIDDEVRLYESSAIVEYLEELHPEPTILPGGPAARALARRLSNEADAYLYPALRRLMTQTLFRPGGDGDPAEIADSRRALEAELERFEAYTEHDYLAGDAVTLADFAVYPMLALAKRIVAFQPGNGVPLPPRLLGVAKRVEALPYFGRTVPPHWKTA
jgi:glutathione S-transferase